MKQRFKVKHPIYIMWENNPDAVYYKIYKSVGQDSFRLLGILDNKPDARKGIVATWDTMFDSDTDIAMKNQEFYGVILNTSYTNNLPREDVKDKFNGLRLIYFADFLQELASQSPRQETSFISIGQEFGSVAYFQQRLILGGDEISRDTLIGSEIANYKRFSISDPINAADAFKFSADAIVKFNHLKNYIKLIAFGLQGEFVIASNEAGVIDHNPSILKIGDVGSCDIPPVTTDSSCLFVNRNRNRVYDLNYVGTNAKNLPKDISFFANHYFKYHKIISTCWVGDPHNQLWCVRKDGKVMVCTYVKDQGVIGWSEYDFGGVVKDVVSIPEIRKHSGEEWLVDSVYIAIERDIGGKKKICFERSAIRDVLNKEEMVIMDSSKTFDFSYNVGGDMILDAVLDSGKSFYIDGFFLEIIFMPRLDNVEYKFSKIHGRTGYYCL